MTKIVADLNKLHYDQRANIDDEAGIKRRVDQRNIEYDLIHYHLLVFDFFQATKT
jgi:hypothetical protein